MDGASGLHQLVALKGQGVGRISFKGVSPGPCGHRRDAKTGSGHLAIECGHVVGGEFVPTTGPVRLADGVRGFARPVSGARQRYRIADPLI